MSKNTHVSCCRFLYLLLRSDVGWDVVKKPKTAGIAADEMPGIMVYFC